MREDKDIQDIDGELTASLMGAFMSSAALKAGIELDVFTAVSKGATSAELLAKHTNTSFHAMRILADALVAYGLLEKRLSRYSLTPESAALLVKGSPTYVGDFSQVSFHPILWEQAAQLTQVVKAGHSLLEVGLDEAPASAFWQDFQRGSAKLTAMMAPLVIEVIAPLFGDSGPRKVLDVACGSGLYGFSILQRFQDSRLVSVDLPGVIDLTKSTAEEMGVFDRVELRQADVFKDELGEGYDLIVAANIFHFFNIERNIELSNRLYAASSEDAVLLIVDSVADENRETKRQALTFALTMLLLTREGDIYTHKEYRQILEAANYCSVEYREVGGPNGMQLIVAKKGRATTERC